jgi:hypothetical protein
MAAESTRSGEEELTTEFGMLFRDGREKGSMIYLDLMVKIMGV